MASSICLPWPDRAGQDRYLGLWTARTSSPVLAGLRSANTPATSPSRAA